MARNKSMVPDDSSSDDDQIQSVQRPKDLLKDSKFDIHMRLQRYLRHIGFPEFAECVDATGAYAVWTVYFTLFLIIPYCLISLALKLILPIYFVFYKGYYCDIPVHTFLFFRFILDSALYLALFLPLSQTMRHWRVCFLIDFAQLAITAPIILSPITQLAFAPPVLIRFTTTITIVQLFFYMLMFVGVIHRVLFVTKDPYHPAFFATKDANGEVQQTTRTSSGAGLTRTMDVIIGNTKIQGQKEYGRVQMNEDEDDNDLLDNDSDLSDLEDVHIDL